jgi:CBS domain containing-hemolysin-like protein
VLTFLILVFSEIVPKTLGALYWRGLAPVVVRLLTPTIWLMWPLVKMAEGITWLISQGRDHGTIRRDEFPALADAGVREGVLHAVESRIMRSLLRFGELTVADIMTPRTVVFALQQDQTVGDVLREHPNMVFSRIPIYGDSIDDVQGQVLRVDVLLAAAQGRLDQKLASLRRPISSVEADLPLRDLLDQLTADRSHIVLVVDSYGGLQGVVTLEDALETLIGLEIMDEADKVEDMRALAREKWEERRKRLAE